MEIKKIELISIYGAICMFTHFFSLGFIADRARELLLEFPSLPDNATEMFALSSKSPITTFNGILFGVPSAVISSCLIYVVGVRRSGYERGVLVFASYMGVFVAFCIMVNPVVFRSIIDCSYAIIFASICSLTVMVRGNAKKERESDDSTSFTRTQLTLKHARVREIFHLLTWLCITAFVGVFAYWGYQFFFKMPFQVAYSESFHWLIFPQFLLIVLIFFGFAGGLLMQTLFEMADIENGVRSARKA